jgi:hypothetical protein
MLPKIFGKAAEAAENIVGNIRDVRPGGNIRGEFFAWKNIRGGGFGGYSPL